MNHKVLVTGGSGFVGRHCLRRLASSGAEIHATVRSAAPKDRSAVQWHACDLLDASACDRLLRHLRPTHLLHLAWIATPGEFWSSRENLKWLEAGAALIRAFYEHGGRRAVGLGTCAEYAWQMEPHVEDSSPLRPSSIYGQCKLAMGLAFAAAARAYGGSSAWARLFFPYGPGEPAQRIIPAVIRGLLENTPVDCTEGLQVRDFIYVDDAASALVALLASDADGVYNLGSGSGRTLREVIGLIAQELGRPELVRWGARPAPADDPPYVVADMSKLAQLGVWHAATPMDAGLRQTIAAWRDSAAA